MTQSDRVGRQQRGELFEISVSGPLGPVVRHALEPCRTGETSYDTVVLLTANDGEQMVDILGRLGSLGLEPTAITLSP